MAKRMLFIIDGLASIKPEKDTSFALMLSAQHCGWEVWAAEMQDLALQQAQVVVGAQRVHCVDRAQDFYSVLEEQTLTVGDLEVVWMRKDPPVDTRYWHTTQLLSLAMQQGPVRCINNPEGLRHYNEKILAQWFPAYTPPTVVSADLAVFQAFLAEHQDMVIKPLDGMGGAGIFRVRHGDANLDSMVEMLTEGGKTLIMAQRYIPEIAAGDKRILLIDGVAVNYALARIPAEGSLRGNLAAGGRGKAVPLSERDREICKAIGPWLKAQGLFFVGMDVIGDCVTEINITSPTCLRELDAQCGLDLGKVVMQALEKPF